MRLAPIIERFETPLLEKYGPRLTDDIRRAMLAMQHCRDGESLHWLAFCESCGRLAIRTGADPRVTAFKASRFVDPESS